MTQASPRAADFNPQTITLSTFRALLALYPATVGEIARQKATKKASSSTKGKKSTTTTTKKKKKKKTEEGAPSSSDSRKIGLTETSPGYDQGKVDEYLELDEWRYETLPWIVRGRTSPSLSESKSASTGEDKGMGYITKDELVRLMEWKLKHGVYRPALLGMIKGNSPQTVKSASSTAYSLLYPGSESESELESQGQSEFPKPSMDALTGPLRGVGPATASLILSVLSSSSSSSSSSSFPSPEISPPGGAGGENDDKDTPFYSDDTYLWLCLDGYPRVNVDGTVTRTGEEFVRPNGELNVKYNLAEYRKLWEAVREFRGRLGVFCAEVEKVALVVRHVEISGYLDVRDEKVEGQKRRQGQGEGGGEGEGEEGEGEKVDRKRRRRRR